MVDSNETSGEQLVPRLELAKAIALEAGEITLGYFARSDLAVERKADSSPVTIADREAEQHLRARIAAAFPDDGILGEEFGEVAGLSGFRWVLDPIDGTKSFIHGVPLYGNMVAVERDARGVIGVVNIPALQEYVFAAQGQACWYVRGSQSPVPARVSNTKDLSDGLFCTSEVLGFDQRTRREAFDRLQTAARLTRTWGDCYGYLLVATGRAEVMVDPVMNVWDAAAIQPILEEAGGTFTDWQGSPTIHGGEGIGTNRLVEAAVLEITRQYPRGNS